MASSPTKSNAYIGDAFDSDVVEGRPPDDERFMQRHSAPLPFVRGKRPRSSMDNTMRTRSSDVNVDEERIAVLLERSTFTSSDDSSFSEYTTPRPSQIKRKRTDSNEPILHTGIQISAPFYFRITEW